MWRKRLFSCPFRGEKKRKSRLLSGAKLRCTGSPVHYALPIQSCPFSLPSSSASADPFSFVSFVSLFYSLPFSLITLSQTFPAYSRRRGGIYHRVYIKKSTKTHPILPSPHTFSSLQSRGFLKPTSGWFRVCRYRQTFRERSRSASEIRSATEVKETTGV